MVTIQIPKAAERAALARMHVELTGEFQRAFFPPIGRTPEEPDANLTLVAVAVMLGHAEGRPMNASQIVSRLNMPRSSVLRRLDALTARGQIERVGHKFHLEPQLAANVPHGDRFDLILSRAFAVLGPHLSKTDS